MRSGAKDLRDERGVSRGSQEYDTDERLVQDIFCSLTLLLFVSMFPVSEPVEKYEGKLQSTGEAKYVDDIPRGESGYGWC